MEKYSNLNHLRFVWLLLQYGIAGWKKGTSYLSIRPAATALMYDPEAPLGKRYSETASVGKMMPVAKRRVRSPP